MINKNDIIALLEDVVRTEGAGTQASCVYSYEGAEWRRSAMRWRDAAYQRAPRDFVELEEFEKILPKPVCEAPVCIAGQVVFRLGGVEALSALAEGEIITSNSNREILTALGLDYDAREVLRRAQLFQDNGNTWGEALAEAKSLSKHLDV